MQSNGKISHKIKKELSLAKEIDLFKKEKEESDDFNLIG
jgi:hypothetical protein